MSVERMNAILRALGRVPEGASRDAAERLQASMRAASAAKGRSSSGTATATGDGIAVSVRTHEAFVSDSWRDMITAAIGDAYAKAAK